MTKKKNLSQKEIVEIIFGVLLLLVFLFIGINMGNNKSSLEDSLPSDSGNSDFISNDNTDYNEPEIITISGMNEVITINSQNPSSVYISGMGAVVYFSKESNPKEIYLQGMNSIAYLCKDIHTPIVKASGMGAKAIYEVC
jgi:hypothetical protein